MQQFLGKLGATCVYKPRRVELIAEMLLVEAKIDDSGMWRVVEGDSGLAHEVIVSARWVKAPGQRVAHAKVEFVDTEAANHAIDNGMYFQGKHIRVRKSEEEAKHCVKCQKFDGHLANACTSLVDVCGCCAGDHRTLLSHGVWHNEVCELQDGRRWCSGACMPVLPGGAAEAQGTGPDIGVLLHTHERSKDVADHGGSSTGAFRPDEAGER
ncbi:hypothetical protein K438DRAFT_2149709, partial [Mycena galopus ATCC 62051]